MLTPKLNVVDRYDQQYYQLSYNSSGDVSYVKDYDRAPATTRELYFTYDNAGKLKSEKEQKSEYSMQTDYSYDARGNRVLAAARNLLTNTQVKTAAYEYDKNNRLASETDSENGTQTVTGYAYDRNGNTLVKYSSQLAPSADGEQHSLSLDDPQNYTQYTYDLFDRLKTVQNSEINASYTYFGDNLRASKTVNGTTTAFTYDGGNLVRETVGNNVYNYTYGYDLIDVYYTGYLRYFRTDYHGSVSRIDTKAYTYDAFGNQTSNANTARNPFGYCGEYTDDETGFVYLRNRYYDPEIGRFLSEDPAKDGMNWYIYCYNNPINYIDTWGLASVAIRDYTTGYGGDVNWDDTWGVASFGLNGNTLWATGSGYNDNGIAITNIGGRLYAEDTDLNNFFFGVTVADTAAGVMITMSGGKPYIDISTPVSNALSRDVGDFEAHSGDSGWFSKQVGNKGPWNLKYRESDGNHWEETLGISFWGYSTKMMLNGRLSIVEEVGNITYGYLGTAAGMSESWMNTGSSVNHFFKHGFFGWDNEKADKALFALGINWYNTGVMK